MRNQQHRRFTTTAESARDERRQLAMDLRSLDRECQPADAIRRMRHSLELVDGVLICRLVWIDQQGCREVLTAGAELRFVALSNDLRRMLGSQYRHRIHGWIDVTVGAAPPSVLVPAPLSPKAGAVFVFEHDQQSRRSVERLLDVMIDAALLCEPTLAMHLERAAAHTYAA